MIKANFQESPQDTRPIRLEDIEVKFDFNQPEEARNIGLVNLTIKSKETPELERELRYIFNIQAFAVFELDTSATVDDQLAFVRRFNAAQVVVGSAREQLAQLTARGPWGAAMLPPIPIQALAGKYPTPRKRDATSQPSGSEYGESDSQR
jgi:preprotein translocase subunit SecB